MIHEQISLGGAPVVGFGSSEDEKRFYTVELHRPIIGFFVGSIAGALLGNYVKKGVGTAVGTIVGGVGGVLVGGWKMPPVTQKTNIEQESAWHKLQPTDTIKAGQYFAIAVAGPNRTPFPPEELSKVDEILGMMPHAGVTKLIGAYPPGSPVPSDWPKDDDLGPGAYRVMFQALVNPPGAADLSKLPPPEVAMLGIWIRDGKLTAESFQQPMRVGESWTASAVVRSIKPWTGTNDAKNGVEDAIVVAFNKIGLEPIDADWDGTPDVAFPIMFTPTRETTLPPVLPLASEWVDQISFKNVAWAPVTPNDSK